MNEPPAIISQEELEQLLLGYFSGMMEWFAPVFVNELILAIRQAIATGKPQDKAYIGFDNLPEFEDLFWYQYKKSDLMDKMKSDILAFDEEKGMLALREYIKECNEKHAGEEANDKAK